MKILVPAVLVSGFAAAAVALAPSAVAVQDDVLCSSNMAYRKAHAAVCADIAINSHGGGGAWAGKDTDRDGVKNGVDAKPYDRTQH